jgi:2-deoxy-D-gluconate 3-dehydrogenase
MILDSFKLDGKVALVTGARRGLGLGIATGLAQAGADIFGVGTGDMAPCKEAVESAGRRFNSMKADLISQAPINEVIDACVDSFGRIDILVNNSGIIRRAEAIDFTEQDWDDVMNLNLKTIFFLSQRAAKIMIAQGGGKIINIASMLSYQGGIRVASYTSSKSGLMGLTRILANEWAKYNINVNAIAPGYMITDNTEALRNDPVRTKEILVRIPAGRWGDYDEIAGTAVFLSSDASKYIHGFTIAVDGGWLAR